MTEQEILDRIRTAEKPDLPPLLRALGLSDAACAALLPRMSLRPPKPVTVNGTDYPSLRAAARALNISPYGLRSALDRGDTEVRPLAERRRSWRGPVTIRGVTYPSQRAAAEALGVTQPAISLALRRGTAETLGLRTHDPLT